MFFTSFVPRAAFPFSCHEARQRRRRKQTGHCSSAEQRRGLLARCQVSILLFAARRGVWFAYLIEFGFGAVKNNQKVLDPFHAIADSGIPASLEPAERKPFLSSLQPDTCSSQASLVQALCRGPSRSSAWLGFVRRILSDPAHRGSRSECD